MNAKRNIDTTPSSAQIESSCATSY